MSLIGYTFRGMERILWGSYIRIFELTKCLGIPLIHGRSFVRLKNVMKTLPLMLRTDGILIFDYYPLLYDFLLLNYLQKTHNILFDIADIPHLQLFYFNSQKNLDRATTNRIRTVARNFFWLTNTSDTLLCISPTLANLMDLDLKNKKVIMVPNASNPFLFKKSPVPRERKKVILYVGGYAPMRGIELLVEAFNFLRRRDDRVFLKLVGDNFPRELQGDGIIIEKNRYYFDIPDIYSQSNVCVIPHLKNPYMDSALPIKLFDSMAASRPVVVTDCFEMAKLVKNEKCGLVVEENAESLAEAIDYLLSNESLSQEMGERGREAIEERHSWAHRAQAIIKGM